MSKASSNQITVRCRRKQDIHGERIVHEGYEAWRANVAQRHLYWPAPSKDADFDGVFVAELDGKVIGRARVEAVYPPFGELQNMNVQAEYRGRGAGGALIDACIAKLGSLGFLAAFLQTHFDNRAAQRLYARKGFFPVAKGRMLRLLRFISQPVLETFLHDHPLATYRPPEGSGLREWVLEWQDWLTKESLRMTLTGGSSDKDSDEYGPGIAAIELRSSALNLSARLAGPATAGRRDAIQLRLELTNIASAPLDFSAHLLLPPGCEPVGEWKSRGPATKLEPGKAHEALFDVELSPDLDLPPLRHATWESLPLTAEVNVGRTSFWLSHSLMVKESGESVGQ